MSLLPAGEIAAMRDTMTSALPDLCTIQRAGHVSDGGGGTTTTWNTLATAVACRISPVAGGEGTGGTLQVAGSRLVDETTHIVTLTADQDVTEADRFVINAQTYDITQVRKRGAWELSRRVECRETP